MHTDSVGPIFVIALLYICLAIGYNYVANLLRNILLAMLGLAMRCCVCTM